MKQDKSSSLEKAIGPVHTARGLESSKSAEMLLQVSPRKEVNYYCILPGNGYSIIKGVMDEKQGWEEIKQDELWLPQNINKISFIWKPCNFNHKMYGIIDQVIASRQLTPNKSKRWVKNGMVINHLENHREITTKTGLLRSLKYYYKDNITFIENNYTLFDSTPTSFVVNTRFETDQYTQFSKRYADLQKNAQPFKEKMPAKHSE